MEEQSIIENNKWYKATFKLGYGSMSNFVRLSLTPTGILYVVPTEVMDKKRSYSIKVDSITGDMERICIKGRASYEKSSGGQTDNRFYFYNIKLE